MLTAAQVKAKRIAWLLGTFAVFEAMAWGVLLFAERVFKGEFEGYSVIVMIALPVVGAMLGHWATRWFVRDTARRLRDTNYKCCTACGFDLASLDDGSRCPECGLQLAQSARERAWKEALAFPLMDFKG